jgi:hypothetical protein
MSDWDILFAMQHHLTPTRLLDWTEILGVAVYFAVEYGHPIRPKAPVVWVLNPYRLNALAWGETCKDLIAPENLGWEKFKKSNGGAKGEYWTYGEIVQDLEEFGWDLPVAIYPRQKTDRMQAQSGRFTIHGDVHLPLDQLVRQRVLQSVPIPDAAIDDALSFLEIAGINRASLFPDLDNLSFHLRKTNGLLVSRRG